MQDKIEQRLFEHRFTEAKPTLYLYDVTSSYFEGTDNEYAEYGYNRDKKKGKKQIVIGLLTDDQGWPVSIEIFDGNTQDLKTFENQIRKLKSRFGCTRVTLVGDRGMIKSGQIDDLLEHGMYYITAISKPQIDSLLKKKVIQLELFTEELFEVQDAGLRYILKKNPVRARELMESRQDKIDKVSTRINRMNDYLSKHPRANSHVAQRKVQEFIDKLKIDSFVQVVLAQNSLALTLDQEALAREQHLDGCYVLKSNLPHDEITYEQIHERYKDLSLVEHAFRTMKTGFLEIRPIWVVKASRTRGHVFSVMLSYLIEKYLRQKWDSIDLTVQEGIQILTQITTISIQVGDVRLEQIPKPRQDAEALLRSIDVTLPPVMHSEMG
jgi:transposase